MESGQIVEYIDSQKIVCAVIIDIKKLRLRLLTEGNREVKMSAGRLSHLGRDRLDLSLPRERLAQQLKEIADRRSAMAQRIDLEELWLVLHSEQQWVDVPTMAALCFPDRCEDDHSAAVIRSFFADRSRFKFKPDRFFPYSAEKRSQLAAQQARQERQQRLIRLGSRWMKSVLSDLHPDRPEAADSIQTALCDYYINDSESEHRDLARQILKTAGIHSNEAVFEMMVRLGVWQPDENIELIRQERQAAFDPDVNQAADRLHRSADIRLSAASRLDLRHLSLVTIDGQDTRDMDDALSIEPLGDHYRVGIHITDVGHHVTRDDVIDCQARLRASSIYMPDHKIPMVPPELAEDLCSLKAGRLRPAISTLAEVAVDGRVIDYQIRPSVVRVQRQMTFGQVDEAIDRDTDLAALHQVARGYRQRRLDDNALLISLPEIQIRVNGKGRPDIVRQDRESPSRLLVAELMVMANELTARYLASENLPAVFRSQPAPRERLYEREDGTLFQNWMQRKLLSRFVLGPAPEPHSGLGLPAYATATSPIRKYTDLVTQRQLRAAAGLESAYSAKQIEALIQQIQPAMAQVARLQFQRHRYWLLKYLQQRVGRQMEAIILNRRRNHYAVLLPEVMFECSLPAGEHLHLKPEDTVQVTIQQVNPRSDTLALFLS